MREFCFKHQLLREAGDECGQCAIEHGTADRDALAIVLGMVDDQGQEITDLKRKVTDLQHRVLDLQRAHNRSAS